MALRKMLIDMELQNRSVGIDTSHSHAAQIALEGNRASSIVVRGYYAYDTGLAAISCLPFCSAAAAFEISPARR